jgi:hypothetical protein
MIELSISRGIVHGYQYIHPLYGALGPFEGWACGFIEPEFQE